MATYSDPTVLSVDSNSKLPLGPLLVLLAGFLSLGGAGFIYYKTSKVNSQLEVTKSFINNRQTDLDSLKNVEGELATYKSFDSDLHLLFDTQHHWQYILRAIEPHLYKQMKITSMQLTDQNSFVFSGVARTYTDYAKIYASLTSTATKAYFKSAKPSSVSKVDVFATDKSGNKVAVPGQTEIDFSFTITLDPQIANAHE